MAAFPITALIVAVGQAAAGVSGVNDLNETSTLLRRASQAALMLPEDTLTQHAKDTVLTEIALAQAAAGDLDGALRTCDFLKLRPNYHKVRIRFRTAFSQAIREPGRAVATLPGVVADAEQLLSHEAWPSPTRLHLALYVAASQWLLGQEKAATTTLDRALVDLQQVNDRLTEPGVTAGEELKRNLRAQVAVLVAEAGDSRRGLQLLRSGGAGQNATTIDAWALSRIAEIQALQGDASDAIETVSGIADPRKRAEAQLAIARVQQATGQGVVARKTLDFISKATGSIDDWQWEWSLQKVGFLTEFAQLQMRVGNKDAARGLVERAQQVLAGSAPMSTPPYLIPLGTLQAELGLQEASLASLHSALALIRDNPDGGEQLTLVLIAAAFARVGDIPEAMRIAQGLDTVYSEDFLRRASVARAEVGDADRALSMVEGIKTDAEKAKAIREVARSLATRDHLPRVLNWSDRQENPLFKAYALLGSAEGLLQAESHNLPQP
jgi:hypothetical protein